MTKYYDKEQDLHYELFPRDTHHHHGLTCPVCKFEGAGLHVEACRTCHGPLLYCGKCGRVECLGTKSMLSELR